MMKAKRVLPCVGVYKDESGRFPDMPIYEMPEETPESWNAKAARMNAKYAAKVAEDETRV